MNEARKAGMMPKNRYQRPKVIDNESLPHDTVCTILTRQSTLQQGEHNVFSAEKNPDELIRNAQQLGFPVERIKLLDWDMGIGAYNTTIEDRPALHHWLTKLLPSGESQVVLVSQEDRLFRDRTEIQVNRFIEQVSQHGGWVICGQRVYNFHHEMDREQFRMVCKYGRQYIEFHIKGRLHPALQRSAMAGNYTGGAVPWGYIVDYDQRSPTYRRLMSYEPHAVLVREQIFGYFASHPLCSLKQVGRHWQELGLVWPFLDKELFPQAVNLLDGRYFRNEELGGYRFRWTMVYPILTNVVYLGWRVRKGQIAWNAQTDAPMQCHEPLIAVDLFWHCFDRLIPDAARPSWAPTRKTTVSVAFHPRPTKRTREPARFLLHGRLRCATHGRLFAASDEPKAGVKGLCSYDASDYAPMACPVVQMEPVDKAAINAFLGRLQFDASDIEALARVAQKLEQSQGSEVDRLRRQLEQQRHLLERARQTILQAPELRSDFLDAMRDARQHITQLEEQISYMRQESTLSSWSWDAAHRAVKVGERIRVSFRDWSFQAQQRVIHLALQDAVLGRVSRKVLGLSLTWRGGAIDCCEIATLKGQLFDWTYEEVSALRQYFDKLTWSAICAMLPARSQMAIDRFANKLGLRRPRYGNFQTVPPLVIAGPQTVNEMEVYGFPLARPTYSIADSSSSSHAS